MNALTIAVAVLSATVTLLAAEATPNSYVSYKNPSTCRSAEPSCATLDRSDSDEEGCTCSGSWQPHCCCPRPRPYSLPPCRQQPTCRPSSCSAPPSATGPAQYQTVSYSPWPTASTSSCPDLPCSAPSPSPCPCPAAAAVPAPAPARLCTCSPFPDQPPCPYCARLQQSPCPSGGPAPSSSVSGLSLSDLAEFMSPSAPCIVPPQRPLLPKLIPVMLKPLSFNVHRPSAACRLGLQGYAGSAPSLLSPCGCGSAPSPYEFYNNK
ncbi:keratinocyte proline-rich protein-like [Rhopalosiphum padi]|uniref:keratinocyte proline-rich protein-like n=1 Tax=Rhopalosiphum padi TaxID=40932 RepID=UPI00298E7B62|nr:keratinocyte proline-rich protein-like [Rhopalosiphum padi]